MMMRKLKNLCQRFLHWAFTPLRALYVHRNGVVVEDEPRHEIPNDVLLGLVSEKLREGHTAVIWVKGYSMRPFIEYERDKVKLAYPSELHIGDAVLAQIAPGHYVLHRIIQIQGKHITLQGDGNLRGVEHCLDSDVCGIVIEYIRPNRVLKADDPTLIRRIKLWRRLRPVRRFLLLFYKAFI